MVERHGGVSQPLKTQIPVFILAAGQATRMFPYDSLLPKTLLPIAGKPFIRHIVALIDPEVFQINVGILESDLSLFDWEFRDIKNYILCLIKTPRGTAGILKDYVDPNEEMFVVWYGDCLVDIELTGVCSWLEVTDSDGILVLCDKMPTDYGAIEIKDEFVKSVSEHKTLHQTFWTGVGVFRTNSIMPYLKQDIDLARDVFPKMIADGMKIQANHADYFDIGTYPAYLRAKKALEKGEKLAGLNPASKSIKSEPRLMKHGYV